MTPPQPDPERRTANLVLSILGGIAMAFVWGALGGVALGLLPITLVGVVFGYAFYRGLTGSAKPPTANLMLSILGGMSMAFIWSAAAALPPDLVGLLLTTMVGVAFGFAFYWGLTGSANRPSPPGPDA